MMTGSLPFRCRPILKIPNRPEGNRSNNVVIGRKRLSGLEKMTGKADGRWLFVAVIRRWRNQADSPQRPSEPPG